MTTNQSLALWELCREGLPLAADEAAVVWAEGKSFELQPGVRISRRLEALIEQCNWEAGQIDQAA